MPQLHPLEEQGLGRKAGTVPGARQQMNKFREQLSGESSPVSQPFAQLLGLYSESSTPLNANSEATHKLEI